MSHLSYLDPDSLGLEEDIVLAYYLGSTLRQVGDQQIGSDYLLKTTQPGVLLDLRVPCLANLSYQLLIPFSFMQQYTDILFTHHCILVLGPQKKKTK